MRGKNDCKGKLQPAFIPEILDMLGQEIVIVIGEQFGSFMFCIYV